MSATAAAEVSQTRRVISKDSALLALLYRNKHFNGAELTDALGRRSRAFPELKNGAFPVSSQVWRDEFLFLLQVGSNLPSFAAALIKYFRDEC